MKVNGQWVPCVRNSYSFMPIALKLYMCYGHGMKICMWLGYNPLIFFFLSFFFHSLNMWLGYTPQINFCHFLSNLNLVIFRTFSHPESELPVGGIVFYKHIF